MPKARRKPSAPRPIEIFETGTPERAAKPDYVPPDRHRQGNRPAKGQDPLAVLFSRKVISEAERDAGYKFEGLFRAQFGPVTMTSHYGGLIRAGSETEQERAADMHRAYLAACEAIIATAGKIGTGAVIDVVIVGNPCGRERTFVVKAALQALAKLWRME